MLPGELAPGTPLDEALVIEDDVLDLEVNPNRPDCLAVYGVAREVHALTGAELRPDPGASDAEPAGDDRVEDHAGVEIDPEICLRFTARVFEDVKVGPSPLWLKQRLTAAGQRPISNVVDITNYVMLVTGQPLHGFDLDKVRGGRIIVRRAHPGERITTLDDVERELDPSMAVVCDAEGPSGIGGVMGGQISELSDDTTRVLMEAATWVGPNILQTSKKLALRSEASSRFEKQLHPDFAMAGQLLAAKLMVELCGARLVPGTIDVYPNPVERRRVRLRYPRIEKLLGQAPAGGRGDPDPRAARLRAGGGHGGRGAGVGRADPLLARRRRAARGGPDRGGRAHPRPRQHPGHAARAPARRRPAHAGAARSGAGSRTRCATAASTRRSAGASPTPPRWRRCGSATCRLLRLANPLSEDQSTLRPAAPARACSTPPATTPPTDGRGWRCSSRRTSTACPGRCPRTATCPSAARRPRPSATTSARWSRNARPAEPADFFSVKAVLGAVLDIAGVDWWMEPGERPFLHPGRAATVLAGDERKLGWLGELHPLVARHWDLPEGATAFEIDFDLLAELAPEVRVFEPISTLPGGDPGHRRGGARGRAVRGGRGGGDRARAGDLLESTLAVRRLPRRAGRRGQQVAGAAARFRAPDRTLTDEEVAERRAAIERELAELGGKLRA